MHPQYYWKQTLEIGILFMVIRFCSIFLLLFSLFLAPRDASSSGHWQENFITDATIEEFQALVCSEENLHTAKYFPQIEDIKKLVLYGLNTPLACEKINFQKLSNTLANIAENFCASDEMLSQSIQEKDEKKIIEAMENLRKLYHGNYTENSEELTILEIPPTLFEEKEDKAMERRMHARFETIDAIFRAHKSIQRNYTFMDIVPTDINCGGDISLLKEYFYQQYSKWAENVRRRNQSSIEIFVDEAAPPPIAVLSVDETTLPSIAVLLQKTVRYKKHGEYLLNLHNIFQRFRQDSISSSDIIPRGELLRQKLLEKN